MPEAGIATASLKGRFWGQEAPISDPRPVAIFGNSRVAVQSHTSGTHKSNEP